MTKKFVAAVIILVAFFVVLSSFGMRGGDSRVEKKAPEETAFRNIDDTIKKGETLFDIFKKYGLDITELFHMREASASVHKLRDLYPGRQYRITLDSDSRVAAFEYRIDDDAILNIKRTDSGFVAGKTDVGYERRPIRFSGSITNNLIDSLGKGAEQMMLALRLSDIFAWDIDFTSDLREGDTFNLVAEGLYLDGEFQKFGDILSAEFMNNGKRFTAYRFEVDGRADYYDGEGSALKKAFLKAPLNFRRISSTFSKGRYHPVLKIVRPHHGIDYAARAGTPVSAIGDGAVAFAGRRGQYGNLVVLRHPNGYRTYYGHLSRIARGLKKGKRVDQGEVIGAVGSTGLATGPHLHFEVRVSKRPVNPLTMKVPRGTHVPARLMAEFRRQKNDMTTKMASLKLLPQRGLKDEG